MVNRTSGLSDAIDDLGAARPIDRVLDEWFGKALLIRRFEQRLLQLFGEGKLFGTVHTCIGQELTGVAVAEFLHDGDQVFSNHRCHGHYLARYGDVEGLLAEVMGKETGICGGRGGSQHICHQGFYSNGVQGGIAPVAAGLALAHQLRKSVNIVAVFIGDGTLGEGVLYETLNIVSKWQLPLLVVLENNQYAQSTAQHETLAGSVGGRPAAFAIDTYQTSTWQPEDLLATTARCVAQVRESRRPAFLQIDTYRLMAHSKGDDDRDPVEVARFWSRDPLALRLERQPERLAGADAAVVARLDAAVAAADAAPFASAGGGDVAPPLRRPRWVPARLDPGQRFIEAVRASFDRNMERDSRIVLLGEDIRSPYGGAFKATKGLSDRFDERVRNMPISEAALVGLGVGLAMNGLRPVCELMFGDFIMLAADQLINHAAKFPYVYAGQVSVPLIVRTPMGGRRGYGATHSQSLEKHFLGVPQTCVLALNARLDPGAIYDTLFATIDRLTLVIENKLMYGQRLSAEVPDGFVIEATDEPFPTLRIGSDVAPDVTILCYGGCLADAEQAIVRAFDDDEIVAEIICPTQLYPFDASAVVESIRRSGRLLIVEEGASFAAFGAEVVAQICEHVPGTLRAIRRIGGPQHPIPSCGPLELQLLPSESAIVRALRELCAGE